MNKIRRFDIFAIFNYLKNQNIMSDDQAKGEAIWLAKLVANRKLYGAKSKTAKADHAITNVKTGEVQYWKTLSDIPQTNLEFDKAIVERFPGNYSEIENAIKNKMAQGYSYEAIRDCEHSHGRVTGWCKECTPNFVTLLNNK